MQSFADLLTTTLLHHRRIATANAISIKKTKLELKTFQKDVKAVVTRPRETHGYAIMNTEGGHVEMGVSFNSK